MKPATPSRSWVESAHEHPDFPLHNLPLGIFSQAGSVTRVGVAIGDCVLDMAEALARGLLQGLPEEVLESVSQGSLNAFFACAADARSAFRQRLLHMLVEDAPSRVEVRACLHQARHCDMHLPAKVGDYTDFYTGIEHATRVGKHLRPDAPLLPNYKYVPIGYHGRASTLRPSGVPVRRPKGQMRPSGQHEPIVGPTQKLDFELELGIWIGQGNPLGEAIPISQAAEHVAGFCLLNDWSARDIQGWEYQPLGPFLSKSFMTTLSPWVVTAQALAPFRCAQAPRPPGDPQPLAYLWDDHDQATGALDIELEALLLTEHMRTRGLPAERLAVSNSRCMYWTVAQLVSHHSVNGCQLHSGDLFGSGTLSGPGADQCGSLLEITQGGSQPLLLASGETRQFLADGDEIILRGRCHANGIGSIGFGECRGRVLPAL